MYSYVFLYCFIQITVLNIATIKCYLILVYNMWMWYYTNFSKSNGYVVIMPKQIITIFIETIFTLFTVLQLHLSSITVKFDV